MTSLPPQTPLRRRPVALRPRGDDYRAPVFPVRERREYVQPIETYDPRNEPRPPSLDEFRDPMVWVGGALVFLAFVVFIVAVSLVP